MTKLNIQAELSRLRELEAALLQQVDEQTSAEKIKALEAAQPMIRPKTSEMARLLETGYNMTLQKAQTIIKERNERPELWPYEKFEAAQNFIAAYEAKPQVISERRPWRRTRG